jgi:type I restriction enzyme S subunit
MKVVEPQTRVRLAEVLSPVSRPFKVEPDVVYRSLGVKWYAEGLFVKEPTPGNEIKATRLFRIESGDFIYNRLFAWKGSFAIAGPAHGGCVVSSEFPAFRVEEKRLVPAYLMRYFSNPGLWDVIARQSSGTAQTSRLRFKEDDFLQLTIPLPPLHEQQRIIGILDAADEMRRLREQADRRTADFIPAIFHEMFGDQASDPKAWPVTTVASLAENRPGSIRTGPFGSDLHHDEFTQEGVPVLAIDNVVTNEFRWTSPRCIPHAKFDEFRRFRVYPGDVLITIMGTVGRVCVTPDALSECMSTKHLCVITVDRSSILPRYLWASLLFDQAVRRQTISVGRGAIMEGWNSTIIKGLRIRVPPLSLQRAFAARVAEVRALEAKQAESRQRLEDLFASLLHRAFRGDL